MKKILIVDDDQDIAKLIELNLKKLNYHVRVVFDSLQGFRLITSEKFDLILLDINLPTGSGFMLAERLRNTPNLSITDIIFISSANDQNIQKVATELGAKAFIQKPFEIQHLIQTIEGVLHEEVK